MKKLSLKETEKIKQIYVQSQDIWKLPGGADTSTMDTKDCKWISRKTLNALIFIIANESADCISYCPLYVNISCISNDTSDLICSECIVKLIHPWSESLWIIGKMEEWMARWDRKTDVIIRWLQVNKAEFYTNTLKIVLIQAFGEEIQH